MTAAGSYPESGCGGKDWSLGFLPQARPALFRGPCRHSESSPRDLIDLWPKHRASKRSLYPALCFADSSLIKAGIWSNGK